MENKINYDEVKTKFEEVKKELLQKVGIFAGCMAVVFFFLKSFYSEEDSAPFFSLLRDSFNFSLAFYLPFKIGYRASGSFILGAILGLILTVIVGLFIGDNSVLLAIILLGGCAIDFGSSIIRLIKAKQLMKAAGALK